MDINNGNMSVYSSYDDLVTLIHESGRDYDMDTIERAYLTAHKAHDGQRRKSGEPYIVHPISVARILVELGMDTDCIVTALLHDVVEDTPMELSDLERDFGKKIAELVDGVTKLRKLNMSSREEHQAENLRKMLIAMNRDIRVIIVKLADRLNNMRTIYAMTEPKQREIATETMEVYAPIADRLGIRAVKEELEDLSLRCLDKVGYNAITEQLSEQQSDREAFLASIKNEITEQIKKDIPHAQIEARIKSVHGIYRKIYLQGKNFEDIYDIYAVRIIVKTLAECYSALGIIHTMYVPLPNRFKDYITMPKQNGYRSLHTTVMRKKAETEGEDDEEEGSSVPFEVQIRTEEMHMTAEYGIAAHWKYKTGSEGVDELDERVAWIRKMLEGQSDDVTDFVDQIRETADVYVFTPRGDIKRLPAGATVIDFAYSIHSQVGHRMIGAKVNNKIVPFNYEVHTGDIVEIQTAKEITTGPKRDWLKIVKTGEAKSKIRSWFKNERREDNILSGREEFARELRRSSIRLTDKNSDEFYQGIADMVHMANMDDVYAAIGYGGLSLIKLMPRVRDLYAKLVKTENAPVIEVPKVEDSGKETTRSGGVIIEGIDDCQYKMSKCCNPLPGDEIVGFITRGFGVSVHKRSCTNIPKDIENCDQPERYVKAHWADKLSGQEFKATLRIVCLNRNGLLADVTTQLNNMHIRIHLMNSRETRDDHAIITVTITVNGASHLELITNKLYKIQNVLKIERP